MSIFSVDKESAQVRFPPPLVFFGFLLIGRVINDWFGLNPAIPDIVRWVLGGGAILAGLVVIALALLRFRRSGNNPEPWKTDTVFVAEGIYRVTRNPMYLGMALVFFGISVAANCLGGLLMLPLALISIQLFVIRREEAWLSQRFGDTYEEYRRRVRRWI